MYQIYDSHLGSHFDIERIIAFLSTVGGDGLESKTLFGRLLFVCHMKLLTGVPGTITIVFIFDRILALDVPEKSLLSGNDMLNKEDIDRSFFRLVAMIMGERVAMHFFGEVGVVSLLRAMMRERWEAIGSYKKPKIPIACDISLLHLECF